MWYTETGTQQSRERVRVEGEGIEAPRAPWQADQGLQSRGLGSFVRESTEEFCLVGGRVSLLAF